MCLLRHRLLGLCPQSHCPPTKPYEPGLEVLWSISRFACSSFILAGKYMLCCKGKDRLTQLLITLPDDCPRLTYFWKDTCLCSLHVQKYLPPISLSEHMILLFFFNFIWLSLPRGHFWEPKFSCQVGFHLEEESNNTESARIFQHSLVRLHDAFASRFPEQESEQSGLLGGSSSNKGSLLPSQSHPSCCTFSHAALLDDDGCFGAPLIASSASSSS